MPIMIVITGINDPLLYLYYYLVETSVTFWTYGLKDESHWSGEPLPFSLTPLGGLSFHLSCEASQHIFYVVLSVELLMCHHDFDCCHFEFLP